MIINNTHRFIYIHIPKTAGSSITKYFSVLSRYCDLEIGGTEFGEGVQEPYRNRFGISKHITATSLLQKIGVDDWRSFYTFTIVRNPISRCVSTFNFLKRWKGAGEKFNKSFDQFINFEDFVLSGFWDETDGPDSIFLPQSRWVYTKNQKEILVNFIGKMENLDLSLSRVTSELKIVNLLTQDIPHVNQGKAAITSIDFSEKVIEKILRKYSEDFSNFGYDPQNVK